MFEQTSRVYAQPMFGICSSCKTNSFCSGVDKYKIQFQCELFPAAAIRYNVSRSQARDRLGHCTLELQTNHHKISQSNRRPTPSPCQKTKHGK